MDKQTYKHLIHQISGKRKVLDKLLSRVTDEDTMLTSKLNLENVICDQLDFLKFFPNLKELSLSNVKGVKNIDGIAYARQLEYLAIYDTYIENPEPIKNCTHLNYLDYMFETNNDIPKRDDFTFIKDLKSLVQLDLTGNNVCDLCFLAEHPTLEQLVLSFNPIDTISPLKSIKHLKWLEIDHCKLSILENIMDFPALESLYAENNNLTDELKMIYLEQLKHLKTVNLD